MAQFFIPHAYEIYIDEETEVPRRILMISTHLAEHSAEGSIADARQEMVGAIATTVESKGLDGYAIKWGSTVESTFEDRIVFHRVQ